MKFNIFDIRRQFPILGREVNGYPLCYLDNAATTFSPTVVLDKVREFETGYRANVARGIHRLASEATDAYESARASVPRARQARLINLPLAWRAASIRVMKS
jgi:cysteine desulfurase/selenocysteine lyase